MENTLYYQIITQGFQKRICIFEYLFPTLEAV